MNFRLLQTSSSLVMILIAAALTVGCKGEDGAVGPQGIQGIQGNQGDPGLGFDEAAAFGNIEISYSGTRPDDVPFSKTLDYQFSSSEISYFFGEYDDYYDLGSNVYHEDDDHHYFLIHRFFSVPDDDYYGPYDNQIIIAFEVDETTNPVSINANEFYVNSTIIDGNKFFTLSYDDYATEFGNAGITNYTYNQATGALSFSFNFTVLGDNNSTDNDLTITGEANLVVLENIGPS